MYMGGLHFSKEKGEEEDGDDREGKGRGCEEGLGRRERGRGNCDQAGEKFINQQKDHFVNQ